MQTPAFSTRATRQVRAHYRPRRQAPRFAPTQPQQLPRRSRCGRLASKLTRDAHRPLDQLRVVAHQLAAPVVHVIFHPHPDVESHRQTDCRDRQLSPAHGAHGHTERIGRYGQIAEPGLEVEQVLRGSALTTLRRRVQHQVDCIGRLEHIEAQQMRDLFKHRTAVDLKLGLDVPRPHLACEVLDIGAVIGKEDLLAADKEVEQAHIERAHLRREQHRVQPLGDRQAWATARRQLDDRVGFCTETCMELAKNSGIHGAGAIRIACMDMEDGGSGTPRGDPVPHDLVRLLRQAGVRFLAMDATRKRTRDDHDPIDYVHNNSP